MQRRDIAGDPLRNEVYGYAHCEGRRGFVFLNNDYFESRRVELRLDESLGLDAKPGTSLLVASQFPEPASLVRPDGKSFKAGDALQLWLRPFEVLMLEIRPGSEGQPAMPLRSISDSEAAGLGASLALKPAALDSRMDMRFADAAVFEQQGYRKKVIAFESALPSLAGEPPILAVAVRLRQGGAEWRHAPTVAQIVQVLARVGDQDVQLVPVPDGRQFGNTQSAGCSWVVYKVRLNPHWSGQTLKLAVHAMLPDGVEAEARAWVVKRWWREDSRPVGDGYYNDAPS